MTIKQLTTFFERFDGETEVQISYVDTSEAERTNRQIFSLSVQFDTDATAMLVVLEAE